MKTKPIFATALCAVLLSSLLAACTTETATSVSTVQVKPADSLSRSDYSGTVHASTSMAVIPNVAAKVSSVHVELGQAVKAGEVLMQLDSSDAKLSLKQAQASYESSRANYEKIAGAGTRQAEAQARQSLTAAENEVRDATVNYESTKSQFESGTTVAAAQVACDSAKSEVERISLLISMGEESSYSLQNAQNTLSTATAQLENAKSSAQTAMNAADSRLKNAQSAYNTAQENYNLTVSSLNPENVKSAKASMESAKVSIEVAQKRVNDCSIVAPIDGLISAMTVKRGDMVSQQMEAFHIFGQGDGMELEAKVTESAAAHLQVGMTAMVTLSGTGEQLEASVFALSPMAEASSGMYVVKLRLQESATLKDGMQATVRFAGQDDGSVLVPQKSLVTDGGKCRVFVVQDGKVCATEVVQGALQGAYVSVTGVATGSEVVLQGTDRVVDGQSVRVVSGGNV